MEIKAILSPRGFIESSEQQNCLSVYRHAHRKITCNPGRVRVQVYHSPQVKVDVVHLDCVCDLLLLKLGPSAENIDVLVVYNSACSRVSGNIEVCDSAPSIVLDVVFLASSVEALRVVSSNNVNKSSF